MKILAGAITEYEGEIRLDGRPVRFSGPRQAEDIGIRIIYQELNLVPQLTVADNIFLGREKTWGGWLGWLDERAMEAQTRRLFDRLARAIAPGAKVGDLRIGDQQMVEIAKALAEGAAIVIMDEPTSALSDSEVARLFRVIADLRKAGTTVLYISHKMNEVFTLADRVTVLRDGQFVASAAREVDLARPDRPLDGRPRDRRAAIRATPDRRPAGPRGREPVAAHSAVERPAQLARHHVFGPGRRGPGRRGAAGRRANRAARGHLRRQPVSSVRNDPARGPPGPVHPPRRGDHGRDRHGDRGPQDPGPVRPHDRGRKYHASPPSRADHGPACQPRAENRAVAWSIKELAIKTAGGDVPVTSLSGGNQQKCILARWLLIGPKVLLLDEPTRGIDVGAKAEIYGLIRRLAAQGRAIIMTSSELPELLAVSDRIIVLCEGRLTAEIPRAQANEEAIMHAATAFLDRSKPKAIDEF